MKMNGIRFGLLTLLILVLSACGEDTVKPTAIDEKTDTCDICNMAVVNNQFATQIVLENGKSLVFDDIGCMYNWINENKDDEVAAQFVRDFNTQDWIETKDATYVYEKTLKTPMAYNMISFKEKKDAEAFIDETNGSLLSFKDLESHKWEMNQEMKQHMKEKHMEEQPMDKQADGDSEN